VPSCSLHQVVNDESVERRIRNIASVAHQASRLMELLRTRFPGTHTTATFRSFEPENGCTFASLFHAAVASTIPGPIAISSQLAQEFDELLVVDDADNLCRLP
jgi:hypothetical protein